MSRCSGVSCSGRFPTVDLGSTREAAGEPAHAPKWQGRLIGTLSADEIHPSIKEMTELQRRSVLQLLQAVVDGKAPLAVVRDLDWPYIDKRCSAETTAMSLPGIEAFDAGSVRAKRR